MHTHSHTHTQNCFMALRTLSGTTWMSRYQKKHSPTHTYHAHQSSLICFLHRLRSTASSLFNLHAWQSFSTISVQVFFGLPLRLTYSTSYFIHFFTQSLSSFCSTCPSHCNLFCYSTEIMSSNPSLSLNPLLGTLSCSITQHIHLIVLFSAHWSATSFSFPMGQVSLQCNILLHTQLLYNLSLTINDISLLVSNGKNCHSIRILVSTAGSASPSTCQHSTCHLNNKTSPLTPDLHWHQYLYSCILYRLLDSCNLYRQMSSSLCISCRFLCMHNISVKFNNWIERDVLGSTWLTFKVTYFLYIFWSSWCHCHPCHLLLIKSRMVLHFWCWLTHVLLEKWLLNKCSVVVVVYSLNVWS